MFFCDMKKRTINEMSDDECKNLVYLILRRYNGRWDTGFAEHMNVSEKDCEILVNSYRKIVEQEIAVEEEERQKRDIPTVESLIENGMRQLGAIIGSCDDPSKVSRTIEILTGLPKDESINRRERKSIFETIQEIAKK